MVDVPGGDDADKDLERKKLRAEVALKEIEVREREQALSKGQGFLKRLNVTITEVTIMVGLLSFAGSMAGAYLQQGAQLAAKEREFEAQLILNAIKETDTASTLVRIRFLIETGYVRDQDQRIANLILSGRYGSEIATPMTAATVQAIASANLPSILQEILRITGRTLPVRVEHTRFTGIAAVTKRGNEYLLVYDGDAARAVEQNRRNNWTAVAILAHEIGHIVLGHLEQGSALCFMAQLSGESRCLSRVQAELEAD